MTRVFVDTNN